jgi:hypothetical protein
MGRVVQADRLVIGSNPRHRLVVLAAARSVGVSEQEMQQRIQVRMLVMMTQSAMYSQAVLLECISSTACYYWRSLRLSSTHDGVCFEACG